MYEIALIRHPPPSPPADIPYDLDEIEMEQLRAAPASEVQGPHNRGGAMDVLAGLMPGASGGSIGGGGTAGGGLLLSSAKQQHGGNTPRGGGGGGIDGGTAGSGGSPGESGGAEVRRYVFRSLSRAGRHYLFRRDVFTF